MKIPQINSTTGTRLIARLNGNGLGATLARLSSVSFLIITIAVLTSGLSKIILVRALGVESYGVFAYVSSWAKSITAISVFGYGMASTRFVSMYITSVSLKESERNDL